MPGPDDNYFLDLKYLRGFLQVQDIIDSAIINHNIDKLGIAQEENVISNVGVYTQQQPYPCFQRDK